MTWRLWLALLGLLGLLTVLAGCSCGECETKFNEALDINNSRGGCKGKIDGKEIAWSIIPDESRFWLSGGEVGATLIYGRPSELEITARISTRPGEGDKGPHPLPLGDTKPEGIVLSWEMTWAGDPFVVGEVSFGVSTDRLWGQLKLKTKNKDELGCTFDLFEFHESSGGGDWD